jgi:hypothetical protein
VDPVGNLGPMVYVQHFEVCLDMCCHARKGNFSVVTHQVHRFLGRAGARTLYLTFILCLFS